MASSISPYQIKVPDAAIQKLKDKLALAELPDEVDFSNDWAYGTPRDDVLRLAKYWKNGFDWRAQEAKLNADLPQFQTAVKVDGFGDINIHFVHKTSSRAGSIPLLFCHGWPGHFLEVAKILPLLTEGDADGPTFHVVAPSLPNFGFSDGIKKRGFSIPQYAQVCHELMLKLGYKKYVTQGGDWGFIITRLMGIQFPTHCLASHINFVRARKPPEFFKTPILYLQHKLLPYSDYEKKALERSRWFQNEGIGYNIEQSTRPSTIGIALADPVALLAWIYEKLHDWTDDYPWTDDEILTWISIYQFSTAGAAASVRIYYESKHTEAEAVAKGLDYVPKVALGLSYFPKDLALAPFTWGRTMGPVVFEKAHPDGGHFAAHERPEALVDDLRQMFKKGAKHVAAQFTTSRL